MVERRIVQSPTLGDFYRDYHHWLTQLNAEHAAPFYRHGGLCFNIQVWCVALDERSNIPVLLKEFRVQLDAAKLTSGYPFNHDSMEHYTLEGKEFAAHLNHQRNQWVQEHAQ